MIEHNMINVINLPERELRLQQFLKEADEQGFGVRVWPGIICRGNNKRGINLAHRQIVQYAKDNNLPSVTIAEDDCRFFAPGAWRYYVENKPNDFDIYFSMYYACDGPINNNQIKDVFSGMTMYTVNQRFYDIFLSQSDDAHIDRNMLGPIAKDYKFMVCDQVVCEQDGSKSDNTKMTTNYRGWLVGRKIFGDVKID